MSKISSSYNFILIVLWLSIYIQLKINWSNQKCYIDTEITFKKKNEKNDALIFPAHNFHSLEIPFSKGEKLSYRNRTKDTVGRESALKLVTSPSFLSLSLSYSSSSTTRSGLSKPWHERCIPRCIPFHIEFWTHREIFRERKRRTKRGDPLAHNLFPPSFSPLIEFHA